MFFELRQLAAVGVSYTSIFDRLRLAKSMKLVVMTHYNHSVFGDLHICFDNVRTNIVGMQECLKSVLGSFH